jgi:hypothetical protein
MLVNTFKMKNKEETYENTTLGGPLGRNGDCGRNELFPGTGGERRYDRLYQPSDGTIRRTR